VTTAIKRIEVSDFTPADKSAFSRLLQGGPADSPALSDEVVPLWDALIAKKPEDRSKIIGELLEKNPHKKAILKGIFNAGNGEEEKDFDIEQLIPPGGFIRTYYDYACEQTDAPRRFHLAGAWSIIATLLGNKVAIRYGSYSIFPNLYLGIIAGSSRFRKSSALNIARSIIRSFEVDNEGFEKKFVYPDSFSPEALQSILETRPCGSFFLNELGHFIQNMKKNYMVGTMELMTNLYDCPEYIEHHLVKKNTVIRNSCVSIFGASTIDWLLPNLKEEGLKGGFYYRFLYLPARVQERMMASPPYKDEEQVTRVSRAAKHINEIGAGSIRTDNVNDQYEEWYHPFMANPVEHRLLDAFLPRYTTMAWKLAMLYEFSMYGAAHADEHGNYYISSEALGYATKAIDFLLSEVYRLFVEEVSFTPYEQSKMAVLQFVKSHPGRSAPRGVILRAVRFEGKKLDDILIDLVDCRQLTREQKSTGGRPADVYTFNRF